MFADIILPINIPSTLTYGIPIAMEGVLKIGMRVEVSLGKNKLYSGLVTKIHSFKPYDYQVKPIKNILDNEPVIDETQLKFWHWVSNYYMATLGDVMQVALPAHLKLIGETKLEFIGANTLPNTLSMEGQYAFDLIQLKRIITISELKEIVGVKHFTAVLNELLINEVVHIIDHLESSYKPRTEKILLLSKEYQSDEAMNALFESLQKAPKQLELLMAFLQLHHKIGFVRPKELLQRTKASAPLLKNLTDKGVFLVQEQIVDRIIDTSVDMPRQDTLNEAQHQALDKINTGLEDKNVALLHGVTGSGKTLLYINKIRASIAKGHQALLLLPEIGITTHLVSRLVAYFGEELGVYHSHFNNNERIEIWEKVRKGTYKVIVGPRSTLWLPFNHLDLIIVDEEHDSSYKQREPSPRLHARDAAIYLAALHGAKVLLGSATPSIESLYNANQHKYVYASIKTRYNNFALPEIEFVNAKSIEQLKSLGIHTITPELKEAIAATLVKKQQVIIFQNRRGYSPFQICTLCGWVPQCKQCAVSLTYHKSTDKMHCHYCGTQSKAPVSCQACGSNSMVSRSFGTEKIVEELVKLFPEARIARMDVDSMKSKKAINNLLDDLMQGKVDILVGTQMVVKGLDIPGVTLVGIISADSLLSFPDFRVNERAFQLMEQVSGRAGRFEQQGKVLIQAYNLGNQVLGWVQTHDLNSYYKGEIPFRAQFQYPPFTRIIKIIFKHEEEQTAIVAAQHLVQQLQVLSNVAVQGPTQAVISRIKNLYIQEVWLKCPKDNKQLEAIKATLLQHKSLILNMKGHSKLSILFDVDPA